MSVIFSVIEANVGSQPLRAIFSMMLSGFFNREETFSIGLSSCRCANSSRRIDSLVTISSMPNL